MNDRTQGLVYLAVTALVLVALFALTVLPSMAPGLPFVGSIGYSLALVVIMIVAFPLLWVGGRRTMESVKEDLTEDDATAEERRK